MTSAHHPEVVLKPLSRPELGEIRIDDSLFAIGRTEQPFASYGNGVVNMLSRRHACIFRKDDGVFLADLESRNGTSVNHVGVGHAPCQLRDGDEICFADTLSYRVQITPHARPEGSLTLTLTPEPADIGLDPIEITKLPFLVSKTEATFSRYKNKSEHGRQLGYLSRRQAYIYQKGDEVYIEDLGSGNGTFIDGVRLQHAIPLQDGVMLAFGGKHFVYRVSITREPRVELAPTELRNPPSEAKSNVVSIVRKPVAEPPNSRTPDAAAVEKRPAPQASAMPAAQRAAPEPAAPEGASVSVRQPAALERAPASALQPGMREPTPATPDSASLSALGHAVVEPTPASAAEPGARPTPSASSGAARDGSPSKAPSTPRGNPPIVLPKPAAQAQPNTPQTPASNKTQFMAAPTSFLDVFCEAGDPKEAPAQNTTEAPAPAPAKEPPVSRRPRNRAMLLLSELASLHATGEPDAPKRGWWKIAAVVFILAALGVTAYFWNATERDLKNAVARGDYTRAATLATQLLDQHPDDVDLKALATDSILKADVPVWLAKVRAHDFDGAKRVLTSMSAQGKRDPHLRPMTDELEWLGDLERLIDSRGGPEAPIRIYADEDSIEHLIGGWNDDTGEHQRTLARIASHVPQFGDWYGEALTHLRKLQSDSTVYLAVIERLKAKIATELGRDDAEALKPILKETAEKYPGLGGLDKVRQDLASYTEIRREARTRQSGRLFALLHNAHFVTPPFQQGLRALIEGGQLPPADLLKQYETATQAWKDGKTDDSLTGLQKIATGAWGEEAAKELERRKQLAAHFAELQQSRNSPDFVDRLLAFRASLETEEDGYFLRATATDVSQQKDKVIARAQDDMSQARTLWEEYRNKGAIDASQRIETSISDQFRTCAHLLAEASRYAQQGFQIYSQVDSAGAAQWTAIRDEIESEVRQQRDKLRDLSNVVEPELLKTKLALLGESNE